MKMKRTREEVLSAIKEAMSQSNTNIFLDAVALYLAKEYIEQEKAPGGNRGQGGAATPKTTLKGV